MVNKMKKLIAKTLLYVVLVESDEFLRQTFDLIWTKNVKFARNFLLERSSSFVDGRWATGRLPEYNYWHLNL